jgi:hypothetical protein
MAKGPGLTAYFAAGDVTLDLRSTTVRMRYLGANAEPAVSGLDPQEGRANYLIGRDPSQWRINVPLYGRVVYENLYPGIDMLYSSQTRLLKSEFIVAPGADPGQIRISYEGVESLRVDDEGRLIAATPEGELRDEAPEIYQEVEGRRVGVEGAFRVSGNVVTFWVGSYDHLRPLRIDPTISYSTFLGGAGTDRANAIAVDATGAAYVTGYTDSSNYQVSAGAVRPSSGGSVDAFVTKLNSGGTAIVYSTYLGGNSDDRGFSIAVDGSGNAYVTGWTGSTNFPLVSAYQSTLNGSRDAFVAKLNSTGTALLYSTYLGGSGDDRGNGVAVDAAGAAYVTGSTTSTNYPVSSGAQTASGGQQDGFVTKLNASGSGVVYSTYLGGAADDRGSSIAVDSSGAAYVAGNTASSNFPVASAVQATNRGSTDAFVTKISPAGSSFIYSTYLGGTGTENIEVGRSIAVDSSGSAYVTGTTSSTDFTVTASYQTANRGSNDAFAVKLATTGAALVYSTYLGGSNIDFGNSIAVDSGGFAFITGYTWSTDFPTLNPGQGTQAGNVDGFIAKLNTAGTAVVESGFLGGASSDSGYGIALDAAGAAYVAGQTLSGNFPLLNPVVATNGGTLAAFVTRFTFGVAGAPSAVSVSPASGSGAIQTFTLVYSDPRGFSDINWVDVNWNTTTATGSACYLRYTRGTNTLQISTNAGTGWAASATPGTATVLQNSQCSVDAGASTAVGAGNSLTLTLAVTFAGSFAGTKNVYMQLQDLSGALAPWQVKGTWVATAGSPASVSVTPSAGSGATQTFTAVFSDPYGAADISYVNLLFQTQITGVNACWVQYTRASNLVDVVADSGLGYAGLAAVGAPGIIQNNQCSVDTGASSVTISGNTLTFNVAVTFKGVFTGTKNIYLNVFNNANATSGWQAKGTWTASGALPPAAVSVTPASGTGSTQVFSFAFSDTYGYADIAYVNILFQTTITGVNACWVQYTRASNIIDLVADSGSGYAGLAILGSPGTLQNNQCAVDTAASSVSFSGNNMTLSAAITFKAGFSGAKNVYMGVFTNANITSGWQMKGVWTAAGVQTPSNVSVSPASGSGSSQSFNFMYADPSGFADISYVNMLFHAQLTGQSACWVQYVPSTNLIYLVSDSGTGHVGSATIGGAGTLTNSQCTVNVSSSAAAPSGNNLTVIVSLTFKAAFAGAKNVYMNVFNNANLSPGWQAKGVWTAP